MAILKVGSTAGESLILTENNHSSSGDPHTQYKLKSELIAEYDTSVEVDNKIVAALAGVVPDVSIILDACLAAQAAAEQARDQALTSETNAATSAANAAQSEAIVVAALTGINDALAAADAAVIAAQEAATIAVNAQAGVSQAEANAIAAANAADASAVSADTSSQVATIAYQAAQAWAVSPEDVPIPAEFGGDGSTTFSALHWATKAGGGGGTAENVYTAFEELNRVNGGIQYVPVTSNRNMTVLMETGESMTVMMENAGDFVINWPANIQWVNYQPPVLTGADAIEIWRVGGSYFGAYVGSIVA